MVCWARGDGMVTVSAPVPDPVRRSGVTAHLVDALATGPLLVVGSLPPAGRDLDLLVPPGARLEDALAQHGFRAREGCWVRWATDDGLLRADVVELLGPEDLDLDPARAEWVWSNTLPLAPLAHLRRPAPALSLLLLARRYRGRTAQVDRWRPRITEALAEETTAWDQAAAQADAWGVRRRLAALRAASTGPIARGAVYAAAREGRRTGPLRAAAAVLDVPRPRRSRVLALSGLDGAGKSTQAQLVAVALGDLGVTTAACWSRMSSSSWLFRTDRRLAGHRRRLRARLAQRRPAGSAPVEKPAEARAVRRLRLRYPWLTWCWAWMVAFDTVVAQRSALRKVDRDVEVVVCDRYRLDSLVHLSATYGRTVDMTWQNRLVRALLPRPAAAVLLRLPATDAFARKRDEFTVEELDAHSRWYDRHAATEGVTVLDALADRVVLAEQIADEVLASLRGGLR